MTSDDESSTLDTIRRDAFPVPARTSFSNNASMFDEFGLNAAADGLFHPASAIEAFTEHDAKYHQEILQTSGKPHSGPRRARSGSEYPPSRENHRLPALHSGKNKRERLSTRPKQPTGNSGSAPASMTTASSLSKLVDCDEGERSLSATQSDSNLYAPRRSDVVPSSADRNALDFLERELESDEDNNSPVATSSRIVSELDNNEIPNEKSAVVPALDFSLAKKFEELKRIMKSNREKHNSARQDCEQIEKCGGQSTTTSTTASPKSSARSAIRAASSGSSATKTSGETASKVRTAVKRSTPVARATTNMHSGGSSGSKRTLGSHTSGAATRKMSSSMAVAVAPPIRSKREVKARSGVSLSDLKAEHREALQMLKELGGPVDPDYLLADVDQSSHRLAKSSTRAAGLTRSTGSTVSIAGRPTHKNVSNQVVAASTPPTSANSGISMVTKLRDSISSGRSSSRESSPRTISPTISSGGNEKVKEALAISPGRSDESPSSSNQTPIEENDIVSVPAPDQSQEDRNAVKSNSIPPALTPNTADASDPWKQYEDDDEDGEDDDNNELESSSEVKRETTSVDRYSDEDFESDW
ncbi:hypothetical protein ON010_g11701 [Phytophthora cinnamomi]|nr:hypothetical protein ON010_g11701 [Phytophthora cinnamomi]